MAFKPTGSMASEVLEKILPAKESCPDTLVLQGK